MPCRFINKRFQARSSYLAYSHLSFPEELYRTVKFLFNVIGWSVCKRCMIGQEILAENCKKMACVRSV